MKSRFLYAGVPKVLYNVEGDLKAIYDAYKADLEPLVNDGFLVKGQRFFLALQNCKGDLPAHISLGRLTRTFRHVQKVVPKGVGKPPAGVCWRCSAGQNGFPFEDNSLEAAWIATVGRQPGFPAEPCSLLELGHDKADPGSFFAFDIWHCDAQGDSQGFWGSAAVLCLDLLPNAAIATKLEALTKDIETHVPKVRRPHCLPITQAKLNWGNSSADYPSMSWSKGSDAATLHVWLEGFLCRYEESIKSLPRERRLIFESLQKAVVAKNYFIRSLYECPLWIESSTALHIAQAGFDYLREQRRLVYLSHQADRNLFMWQPKTHYIGHIIHSFFFGASTCEFAMNPLVDSVQMDEDFVGRPSRLSRRVTGKPLMCAQRTIERYLINVLENWDKVQQ
jgi:hypothetical protein